jgi:hypothetical protein
VRSSGSLRRDVRLRDVAAGSLGVRERGAVDLAVGAARQIVEPDEQRRDHVVGQPLLQEPAQRPAAAPARGGPAAAWWRPTRSSADAMPPPRTRTAAGGAALEQRLGRTARTRAADPHRVAEALSEVPQVGEHHARG